MLGFHWIGEESPSGVAVYRFTQGLFGLNQSPFLLGGTLDYHRTSLEEEFPEEVTEIKESLYVDNIISRGTTMNKMKVLKETAIEIFRRAHFKLLKWHSSENCLEEPVCTMLFYIENKQLGSCTITKRSCSILMVIRLKNSIAYRPT